MGAFKKLHDERYQKLRYRRSKTDQLEITPEEKIIILASDPVEIPTHWVWSHIHGEWRARRCSEDDLCEDCWYTRMDAKKEGIEEWREVSDVRLRFYFLCFHNGVEHWVELGETHAKQLDQFETTVGIRCAVKKSGYTQQSHKQLTVQATGVQIPGGARDPRPFLERFCLSPKLISQDDAKKLLAGLLEIERPARKKGRKKA